MNRNRNWFSLYERKIKENLLPNSRLSSEIEDKLNSSRSNSKMSKLESCVTSGGKSEVKAITVCLHSGRDSLISFVLVARFSLPIIHGESVSRDKTTRTDEKVIQAGSGAAGISALTVV